MKETIVQVTVSEYRHLLQRKPKAEIAKIAAAGGDWNALLPQIRAGMARVKDPSGMIVTMEFPGLDDHTYTNISALFDLLREYYPAEHPLTWGYKLVDDGNFSITAYVC